MVESPALACTTEAAELGEGVRWDARRDELLWVDILRGLVFRANVLDDGSLQPVHTYELPMPVGAIAPVHGDDGWLLAAGRGFVHLAPDGTHRAIAEAAPAGARMNDAACDPQGRCWAGSLADDHHAGGGSLYRLDRDGTVHQMLDGLTIPNGIGWSLDGNTMYLIDSVPRRVYAFDFDGPRGAIENQREFIAVPDDVGGPDGLTVDAHGHLWIAVYGGGQVRRYDPDGRLVDVLRVPAVQSTCAAFGGVGLHRLYVTTATEFWTDEQRRADPAAGLVYRLDTDAVGVPAAPFVPKGDWYTHSG
ncbi:MAG: SMP-30/gluconolactonase/LRE family protein [Actinobacteria bacterium]|nr:SMP-30/gluconolactonase/LRE family protein [Actinomycetota bacterium]